MSSVDYYETLGVSRTADAAEIKKAFRKLAREYHPDVKPGDKVAEEKFKEIAEAYDVLSTAEKRQKYDQFGHAAFKQSGGPGGSPFNWSPNGASFDLNDILGDLFGGGSPFGGFGGGQSPFGGGQPQRRARPQKGQDVRAEITVPFQVAVEGGEHEIQLNRGGKSERLGVKIPSGVDGGSVIRLSGQGQPGQHGGPDGDLMVTIKVSPHPWFRRESNNLVVEVPITPTEAALGAKVDVPTLTEGSVILTVPPGTSSGSRLRLRGKGVPSRKSGQRGDQHVVIRIDVPKELSSEVEDLYRQIADASPENPRDGLW